MPDLTRNNIAACQIHKHRPTFFFTPEIEFGLVVFKDDSRATVKRSLEEVLVSAASHSFLAFLPENSIPLKDIAFLQDQAVKLNLTIIGGLEHSITWLGSTSREVNDYEKGAYRAENKFIVIRPDRNEFEYGKKNFPARVKGHSVVEQIESNPHPQFPYFAIPTPDNSEMNVWPILCSDFLRIASERSREELDEKIRSEQIDLIAVLSHTDRADAFHRTIQQLIVGDVRRSLPTNILFANFAVYGGTFCLAHDERRVLRGSGQAPESWETRIIPAGEESVTAFADWASALQSVRTERTR